MIFALECLGSFWLACLVLSIFKIWSNNPRARTDAEKFIEQFRSERFGRLRRSTDEAERQRLMRELYDFERALRRAQT